MTAQERWAEAIKAHCERVQLVLSVLDDLGLEGAERAQAFREALAVIPRPLSPPAAPPT